MKGILQNTNKHNNNDYKTNNINKINKKSGYFIF